MQKEDIDHWKGAVATAWVASGHGVLPIKSATVLAVQEELEQLRKVAEAARSEERERMARLCDDRAESTTIDERDALVWASAAELIRNAKPSQLSET